MGGITLKAGQILTIFDIDRIEKAINIQIKAAEDKRGKEVLDMAKKIFGTVPYLSMNEKSQWERFCQAYKERFNE